MQSSSSFQFLGIPPKGEPAKRAAEALRKQVEGFQFLGIPPKGELGGCYGQRCLHDRGVSNF